MAISYPLDPPSSPGGRRTILRRNTQVGVSMSPYTLSTQVYDWGVGLWLVDVALPLIKDVATADQWEAWLLALNGQLGTFHYGDDMRTGPRGIGTGTPKVNGASQVGRTLVTDGWTISTTGIMLRGDYIQIGSSATQRLYRVVQDANSDSGGNATLEIWPDLREQPADNADITVSNCKGTFRLLNAEDDVRIADANKMHLITFSAIEAYGNKVDSGA